MTTTATKATHTPGPWSIHGDNQTMIAGPIEGEMMLANACRAHVAEALYDHVVIEWSRTLEVAQANARLIAAAPELLAALQTLTDHAQERYPHFESERGQRDIDAALAAIAKATS